MVNQWIDQWILESTTCCAERAENTTTSRRLLAKAPPTGSPLADREAAIAGDCASDLLSGVRLSLSGEPLRGLRPIVLDPPLGGAFATLGGGEDKKQKQPP
jgi:hypothetical protein